MVLIPGYYDVTGASLSSARGTGQRVEASSADDVIDACDVSMNVRR